MTHRDVDMLLTKINQTKSVVQIAWYFSFFFLFLNGEVLLDWSGSPGVELYAPYVPVDFGRGSGISVKLFS